MTAKHPLLSSDNYRKILLSAAPMIDLRAPVEFAKGSFPNTINLPLINDEERALIGTAYRQKGGDAALSLGYALVKDKNREEKISKWRDFAEKFPRGFMFCFRGGLRSRISQQWLAEQGIKYPVIKGGYKAMRRFLLDEVNKKIAATDFIILGGHTGCGKTRLINRLKNSIDLEWLANHRGSSFGGLIKPQPTQINFENTLAIELIQQKQTIILEDEGANIGSCSLPHELINKMRSSPLIVLNQPLEDRIKLIYADYIMDKPEKFLHAALPASLDRIKKRLGGANHANIRRKLELGLKKGTFASHYAWIKELLGSYYDPMYEYQLGRKQDRIIFSGGFNDIIRYLHNNKNDQ